MATIPVHGYPLQPPFPPPHHHILARIFLLNRPTSFRRTGTSVRALIVSFSFQADGAPRLTLNLRSKEGQGVARRLVERADVLVEN